MSVYFLRPVGMKGPIKIGYSDQPKRRLKEMMMWSPIPLELFAVVPGDRGLEGSLHRAFRDAKSHWEWFRPIPELIEAINRMKAGVHPPDAFDFYRLRRIEHPDRVQFMRPWPRSEEQRAT